MYPSKPGGLRDGQPRDGAHPVLPAVQEPSTPLPVIGWKLLDYLFSVVQEDSILRFSSHGKEL